MGKVTATREQYEAAFLRECDVAYPMIDQYERESGFAVDGEWMLGAARVLACPVKNNPPNWQHGRVLYATVRSRLLLWDRRDEVHLLDIGTAKGFSALVMSRALADAKVNGTITSIDVIDPQARAVRNTIAEVGGLRTLHETVAPWPESRAVKFVCAKAENWLMMYRERFHFAFVDGKHTYDAVTKELTYLSQAQESGDVIMCDDLQVPGVAKAIGELEGYHRTDVWALANRGYAVLAKAL